MAVDTLAGYPAIQDYLFNLKVGGSKFGVDRMRLLAAAIGHPERAVPCIHVAGTNGKGSVSAMLESVLRTSGFRTGLYTSPHLVRLGERVQVNRQPLSEPEIIAYTNELARVSDQLAGEHPDDRASFFEFMTAMAFLQFARMKCDLSVIEVGLGGRLDATNIVEPEISVVTSIGLDHCELLGDTIEMIAAEKAGIIKKDRPVVIGLMPEAAENTIRSIAREKNSPVVSVREEFGSDLSRYPSTNLEGDYQRWNAATAALVLRNLPARFAVRLGSLETGLDHVHWPGRWQRVTIGGRLVVLDASHNPEGAQVLESNLVRLRAETGGDPVVITGALGVNRATVLLDVIARHAKALHLVVPNQARACSHSVLESLIPVSFQGPVLRATVESLFPEPDVCTVGTKGDVIVVTGSIYLLGEVLSRLDPTGGKGEGRLQDF